LLKKYLLIKCWEDTDEQAKDASHTISGQDNTLSFTSDNVNGIQNGRA
jgi:hypothetical protein